MTAPVRVQVAAQIAADNAEYLVRDFPADPPDNLARGKVMVTVLRESLTNNTARTNTLGNRLSITVITATSGTSTAETALDAALDQVLLSLTRFAGVEWSEAKRVVVKDSFPGWEIGADVSTANVYKSTILTETE